MAVYAVKNKKTNEIRLIETRTKSGAINHVAAGDYEAASLNTSNLVKHLKDGLEVETLTVEVEEKYGKKPIEKVIDEKKAEASSASGNSAAGATGQAATKAAITAPKPAVK